MEALRQDTAHDDERPEAAAFPRACAFVRTVYRADPAVPVPLVLHSETRIVLEWRCASLKLGAQRGLLWINDVGAENWADTARDDVMAAKLAQSGDALRAAEVEGCK